jgi:hypothetical protein
MNVLLSWCEKKECDVVSKSLLSIMRMPWRMKMSHIAKASSWHRRGAKMERVQRFKMTQK